MPLTDIELYRPGPYFALVILLVPVAAALVGTAISLFVDGSVPVWLPFLVFLWLPLLPAVWFVLQSVRTNSYGIAAGRPWRTWQEIPWFLVERVEQFGPVIRIFSSNGKTLVVTPLLLRNGGRLKRQLWLRLPAHAFAGSLAQEGETVLVNGVHTTPDGILSGTLRARPWLLWRLALLVLALAALALAGLGIMDLPLGAAILTTGLGAIIALASLIMCGWLAQVVTVSDKGIRAYWTLTRNTHEMTWEQITFVEHFSREVFWRLRDDTERRIVCAGPTVFPRAQRDIMRAFLSQNSEQYSIPIVPRKRLLWPWR